VSEITGRTNFLELLQPQGDKATLNELVEVKKNLPKTVTKEIPYCLWDDNNQMDEEVFIIMSWVRAKRENPDITKQSVGDRVGNQNKDLLVAILKELLYFYSTETREAIEERYAEQEETDEEQQPAEVSGPTENPTE